MLPLLRSAGLKGWGRALVAAKTLGRRLLSRTCSKDTPIDTQQLRRELTSVSRSGLLRRGTQTLITRRRLDGTSCVDLCSVRAA